MASGQSGYIKMVMSNIPQNDRALFAAISIVFVFIMWAHWLAAHVERPLIDEEIVVAVLDRISADQTLDTNWANVESVSRYYPANQYNFSSSILAYGLFSGVIFNSEPISEIKFRHVPILFAGFSLLLLFFAFSELGSRGIAILAISLSAFSYQFISEAISIRPEAFVSLIYAAGLVFALWKRPPAVIGAILVGFCGGILIATKFSMLIVWAQLFLMMIIVRFNLSPSFDSIKSSIRPLALLLPISVIGAVFGVALGAPYALLDITATTEGVQALLRQYGAMHYPFGRPEPGVFWRLSHAVMQTQSHIGILALIFCALAVAIAIRQRNWAIVFLAISTAAVIGYFSIKPVFFARNFSLFVPVMAFLAAWTAIQIAGRVPAALRGAALASLGVALCIQPLLASIAFSGAVKTYDQRREDYHSLRIFLETYFNNSVITVNGWDAYREPALIQDLINLPNQSLVELRSLNDPFSNYVIDRLSEEKEVSFVVNQYSLISHFPRSMVHYNFDINGRYLVINAINPNENFEFFFQSDWCPEVLPVEITGEFDPLGFHSSSHPSFSAFGSWLGGDEAVATARLRLNDIPENTILPVFTGPGRNGLNLVGPLGDRREIFTNGTWIGIPLPRSETPIEITIEDSGTGWGEWMAFAPPRRVCK